MCQKYTIKIRKKKIEPARKEKRILGLDYGNRRIGVAVSDTLGLTAQALEIISRPNPIDHTSSLQRIQSIIKEYGIGAVVLGFPKNMDNSQGQQCEKVIAFMKQLQKKLPDLEIILQDERLSTLSAERVLDEIGISGKKRKQYVDKTAAVFILQNYLDKHYPNKPKNNRNIKNNTGGNKMFEDTNDIYPEEYEDDDDDYTDLECITVTDEDGVDTDFAVIHELDHNNNKYIVLMKIEELDNDDEEGEAIIYKQGEENGELFFEEIDDDEFLEVAEILKVRLADYEFNF